MPEFRPYRLPRGALYDLAHALAIKDQGCNILVLSDAALYAIQNWAELELGFEARWADEIKSNGYYPISFQSPNYSAWVDLVEQIRAEVFDMSCDLVGALADIKASIDALATEQSGWDDLLTSLLAPLASVVTSADIAALSTSIGSADLCCGPASELPYRGNPPAETSNPETSTFCDRCWSFALDWYDAAHDIFEIIMAGSVLTAGILAVIVSLLSLPLAIILGIILVAGGILIQASEDDVYAYFYGLIPGIACAIWNSSSPETAREAARQVIDDSDPPIGFDLSSVGILKSLIDYDALNQIFAETYPIRSDAESSDCFGCQEAEEGDLCRSSCAGYYNYLLVGDDVTGYIEESAANGWRYDYPHPVRFWFTAPFDAPTLALMCQGKRGTAGDAYISARIYTAAGAPVGNESPPQLCTDIWQEFDFAGWVDPPGNLLEGQQYYVQFSCQYLKNAWVRCVLLQSV